MRTNLNFKGKSKTKNKMGTRYLKGDAKYRI